MNALLKRPALEEVGLDAAPAVHTSATWKPKTTWLGLFLVGEEALEDVAPDSVGLLATEGRLKLPLTLATRDQDSTQLDPLSVQDPEARGAAVPRETDRL